MNARRLIYAKNGLLKKSPDNNQFAEEVLVEDIQG